ncbi:MAG: GvpL/GvpF family gas vesicle protein [Chloroflexi bacterium]|nr:GvpL/GvpF family gas vesicle protein [Chloroflexota bacterium]
MAATYVYAVIPTGDEVVFDEVAGVDEHQEEVYTLPHRDIAAVVGSSPLADYRGLKRDQAARYLIAHQRVVETVMQAFPVLPVKFGTVLPGETWVLRLLAQGERLFHASLERLAGWVQMEVVVLWNLQQVFQEVGQELRSNVETFQRSNVADAERVAIGRMVQASLERRRAALRDRLLPSLREVAPDLLVNPLMDDSMVANVALLVDGAGKAALDQRLALLDEEFGGRLTFRCVGPLPPYSFATVEVQLPSFEAVDDARRRLGLGEEQGGRGARERGRRGGSPPHLCTSASLHIYPGGCGADPAHRHPPPGGANVVRS